MVCSECQQQVAAFVVPGRVLAAAEKLSQGISQVHLSECYSPPEANDGQDQEGTDPEPTDASEDCAEGAADHPSRVH